MKQIAELDKPLFLYDTEYSQILATRYANNDNIALILRRNIDNEENKELLENDVILTTNIDKLPDNIVTLDINNLEHFDEIVKKLIEVNVLGNFMGNQPSGYVVYPMFEYKGNIPPKNH